MNLALVSQTTYASLHKCYTPNCTLHSAITSIFLSNHGFPLNSTRRLLATYHPTYGTTYL